MNGSNLLPASILFLAVSFNLYVHFRVLKSTSCEPGQKWAQYALIWLLPVVGAVLCCLCAGDSSARGAAGQASDGGGNGMVGEGSRKEGTHGSGAANRD